MLSSLAQLLRNEKLLCVTEICRQSSLTSSFWVLVRRRLLRRCGVGKTASLTEARTLGGTCVYRGCLPSKNLIEAARILYDSRNPR